CWPKNQIIVLVSASVPTFAAVYTLGVRARAEMPDGAIAVSLPAPSRPAPRASPSHSTAAPHAATTPVESAPPAATAEPAPLEDPQRPALRELANNPTAHSVEQLIAVVQNDGDPRNRMLALSGLRRAALAGIPDPSIIAT